MGNSRKTIGLSGRLFPVLVVICLFSSLALGQPWWGSGTAEDPYQIWTAADMQAIGADSAYWDAHFLLCADIDLSAYTGTSFNIIGYYVEWNSPDNKPFTGIFDGSGHTISDFTYTSTDTDYIGIFGYVAGEIKDLGLIDPDVDAGTGWFVCALVGYLVNGTVTSCYVEGGSVSGEYCGGGMDNVISNPTLTNCILWGNSDSGGYDESAQIFDFNSTPTINYSCVQGWTGALGGVGNIGDDPLFVDPNGPDGEAGTEDDNLRLSADSTCIDAGDNGAIPIEVATDLDDHPRIIDGDCNDTEIVDMGTYEFNYAYIGDFDYQCDVDFVDFAILALAWLTEPPDENWNQFCDISIPADKKIDWADVEVLSAHWLAGK